MGERAKIDIEYMSSLCHKSEKEIYDELQGVIFLNPEYNADNPTAQKYLMADEYLSGNVRAKLRFAKAIAKTQPEYQINVESLEKVQPKDLTASEIDVRLGATWLPVDVVENFMYELLEIPYYCKLNIKVNFLPFSSEWNITNKSGDRGNVKANSTYGTSRIKMSVFLIMLLMTTVRKSLCLIRKKQLLLWKSKTQLNRRLRTGYGMTLKGVTVCVKCITRSSIQSDPVNMTAVTLSFQI